MNGFDFIHESECVLVSEGSGPIRERSSKMRQAFADYFAEEPFEFFSVLVGQGGELLNGLCTFFGSFVVSHAFSAIESDK
jgi:hypothetical protein